MEAEEATLRLCGTATYTLLEASRAKVGRVDVKCGERRGPRAGMKRMEMQGLAGLKGLSARAKRFDDATSTSCVRASEKESRPPPSPSPALFPCHPRIVLGLVLALVLALRTLQLAHLMRWSRALGRAHALDSHTPHRMRRPGRVVGQRGFGLDSLP